MMLPENNKNRKMGKTGILIKGMYYYYRNLLGMKGYMDKRNDFNVSFQKYCEVIRLFNKKLKDALIYDSFVFVMPYRLGKIYIRRKKMYFKLKSDGSLDKRNLVPDWPATKKLWKELYPDKNPQELKQIRNKKIVYYTNEHSYGYKFKIHWEKKYSTVRNHGPYEFIFARDNRRELAAHIKSKPSMTYYE